MQNMSSWFTRDMIKETKGPHKEPSSYGKALCSINLYMFNAALYAQSLYSYATPQDLRSRRNSETMFFSILIALYCQAPFKVVVQETFYWPAFNQSLKFFSLLHFPQRTLGIIFFCSQWNNGTFTRQEFKSKALTQTKHEWILILVSCVCVLS